METTRHLVIAGTTTADRDVVLEEDLGNRHDVDRTSLIVDHRVAVMIRVLVQTAVAMIVDEHGEKASVI